MRATVRGRRRIGRVWDLEHGGRKRSVSRETARVITKRASSALFGDEDRQYNSIAKSLECMIYEREIVFWISFNDDPIVSELGLLS